MGLTKEQEKVVNTRGKNMLVAAAAGSGKTFVLVKRIISEILDNGIDVDRILVVTFTNAAAAEMKDRIRKAIDTAVNENNADKRIRTQATLIHSAHIRTIDSFCNWVVKNYFYEIDKDPSFRVGSAGELKIMADEVFKDLLSSYLESKDEDFRLLADAYISKGRTDTLRTMVFDIYNKAVSFAWTDEWFENSLRIYDIDSLEALEESSFMKEIMSKTNLVMGGLAETLKKFIGLYPEDASSKDKDLLNEEFIKFQALVDAESFSDKVLAFDAFKGADGKFPTLRFNGTALNEDDVDRIKAFRDSYKKIINSYKEEYFSMDPEELLECIQFVKKQATALIRFTKDYAEALYEEKSRKNIYSFNDVEHMALEILRNKDTVEHEKRPVAIELTEHFKEVMVDEYQDSNELQEQILTAVSNGTNYFTVGDVKQSIYAFRQASPKLFIDKLNSYPMDDDGDSIRIDLDNNFRSRGEVLNFCNDIFRPMMQPDMGGVSYDKKAELKVGDKTFKGDTEDYQSEIMIGNQDSDSMKEFNIESSDELEALMVANRINQLKADNFMVSFKENDARALRPMKYSDVVILMSSTKNPAGIYIETLKNHGIPAYVAEETGFFEREEVETVLSMLKCIDNPFNDIPLAAVLHSAMFGFSTNRLAQIRTKNADASLYTCLLEYQENHNSEDITRFLDTLERFRDLTKDTPIHEIIEILLEETGYGLYVKALPLGKTAYANLEKLIDEAVNFESTSFKGLSRFVDYIEGLKTYEEDLGIAKTVGENDDAVRIMTIHKSKGLEFPVVFVCGCGKTPKNDTSQFAYDDNLGVALNYRNPITRVSCKTPFFSIVRSKSNDSAKGEFFRKLYVALTRPVDKLIITAAIKPTTKKSVADIVAGYTANGTILDYYTKDSTNTAIEFFIRSLNASSVTVNKKIVDCQELFVDEVKKTLIKEDAKRSIYNLVDNADIAENNDIVNTLSFTYDALADSQYKSKYSVSEIKHQAMEKIFEFNSDAAPAFIHNETESYIPSFMRQVEIESDEAKVPAGALYGTAMHRFMECFDFARDDYKASFDEQLDYMKKVHMLSEDELERIRPFKLKKFLEDDVAERMSNAAKNGKLYKEKPFVFGSDSSELFGDNSSDEMILVQGIIDVFFEEEDGIVLLDYKTDRVDEDSELVLRYDKQLQLYKSAIEKAYNTPVKETLLYSFALDKTIRSDSNVR